MPLGAEVGLGPDDIVLDGDRPPLPKKGTEIQSPIFGRPFVKRFALCYRSVVCLSCLSVTLVYCGQTVGRIKMKLGMQVGLGTGHIVLGGNPAPPPLKGHSPSIFGPCLLRSNGCMDQDVTWYGGRPRLRRLCVRWGPSPLPPKGAEPPPQFSAHFYCGQTTACIKMPLGIELGLGPGDFVLDGDPAPSSPKGAQTPTNFRPISVAAKWLHGSRCHLVWSYASA